MKYLLYGHRATVPLLLALWRLTRHCVARWFPPMTGEPRSTIHRRPWRRWLAAAALVLGFLVQLVLLWLLGELVDLCISLMELWAELARKHLEIML